MFFSEDMAQNFTDLPSSVEKRDILYGVKKMSVKELTELGTRFEKAGWISDAVDFYTQAKDHSSLKKLQELSAADGDVFMLLKIARVLGEEGSFTEDLKKCSARAESLGKIRYAMKGYEKLGDAAKVESLRASIAQDGDIVTDEQSKIFIPLAEDDAADALEE